MMKKVLVTYFSASGVTARVAEKLAAGARVAAEELTYRFLRQLF